MASYRLSLVSVKQIDRHNIGWRWLRLLSNYNESVVCLHVSRYQYRTAFSSPADGETHGETRST